MSVSVEVHDGPLPAAVTRGSSDSRDSTSDTRAGAPDAGGTDTHAPAATGSGARVIFEGIVRALESGRPIMALDYEAYQPMAQRELARLAEASLEQFELHSIHVAHSVGRVAVGACSFRLIVESAHREPALRAMAEFIERMKRDVPIWKRPVWSDAVTLLGRID